MSNDSKPDENKAPDERKAPEDFQFPSLHGEEPASETRPTSAAKEASEPTPAAAETPNAAPAAAEAKKAAAAPAGPPLKERVVAWFIAHKPVGFGLAFILIVGAMKGIDLVRNRQSGGGDDQKPPVNSAVEDIPVNATEVKVGRFQDTINAVGTLKGETEIELRFQVDGRIEDLNIQEGQKVRKGQLLGRLDDRDARLKVERARIELEQTERLFQLGGVSRNKLQQARLDLDVAQAEMDKTRIIAAKDGIIGEKEAEIGEFVSPQKKIAKLVSIKNVVVEVGIIERQVDKVYPGQKILVTVDAYPANVFEGVIETISPIIGEDGSKTFSIRSKIPNPDSLLLPGMFARTRIITYEADDAISVPNDALIKSPGGFQVFVINKDNVAEARDVQVGHVATDSAQIESGLNAGEMVIVQKPPELKAGRKVKIIEVQK